MRRSRWGSRLEAAYGAVARLYPEPFRGRYAEPMRQSFRDGLADEGLQLWRFAGLTARDLVVSLGREYMAAMMESLQRPALVFNALVLAGLATLLGLALYAIPQQVLRQAGGAPQHAGAGIGGFGAEFVAVCDGV